MPEIRIEQLDRQVLALVFDPTAEWAYSKFPHPLITADYDADGRLIQIIALGRKASGPFEALAAAFSSELVDATDSTAAAEVKEALCVA